jgi:hypothetical protein
VQATEQDKKKSKDLRKTNLKTYLKTYLKDLFKRQFITTTKNREVIIMKFNNIIKTMLVLGACALVSPAAFAASYGNSSVKANASLDMPSAVMLTGTDNVTTVQDLTLNASNIKFDQNLNAAGNVSILWKGNANSDNGFMVTIQRSAINGTANDSLIKDLSIKGMPAAGGDQDAVIAGDYVAGKPLPSIAEARPEQFCSTSKAGSAVFGVELGLNAPSNHGKGTASTVLTFVAAAL